MAHKFLSLSLVVIVVLSGLALLSKPAAEIALAHEVEIDQAVRRRILEASIKIRMIAPAGVGNSQFAENIDGGSQDRYFVASGLGTLAKIGNESVIVTHDHWSLLSNPQTVILISSAADEIKLVFGSSEFVELIRFRDGGTMIIDAPAQLAARSSLAPELTAESAQGVQSGDILYAVRRQPEINDALSVEPVIVKSTNISEGPSTINLQSVNGIVVGPGNSGGGVWHDGQLVANIWSAFHYQKGGSATGDYQPTNLSQAAQLPFLPSS